jgi:hypothetical protein
MVLSNTSHHHLGWGPEPFFSPHRQGFFVRPGPYQEQRTTTRTAGGRNANPGRLPANQRRAEGGLQPIALLYCCCIVYKDWVAELQISLYLQLLCWPHFLLSVPGRYNSYDWLKCTVGWADFWRKFDYEWKYPWNIFIFMKKYRK